MARNTKTTSCRGRMGGRMLIISVRFDNKGVTWNVTNKARTEPFALGPRLGNGVRDQPEPEPFPTCLHVKNENVINGLKNVGCRKYADKGRRSR
ncbi:hypothetical protein RRF57_001973 [Xylaria bambusicola]|uniref:Uncharacterized protein n=1 Tax=Xylaria bambusicola TaxID=326684 RepID=A0AAN7Z425_9PEZI